MSDAQPTPRPDPAAGHPPGFRLMAPIGEGGMGCVYRARDLTLRRHVAVKLLRTTYPAAGPAADRFRTEAKITARLQHPGIPPVYHVGRLPDGRPFLAMKLIKGRTLDAAVKADGPGGKRWLAAFEAICQAVGYAHSKGVIHRDLKPANVMVGAFGEVQVMDWGLAKVLGRTPDDAPPDVGGNSSDAPDDASRFDTSPAAQHTRMGAALGTFAFMPPEQARGLHTIVDAASDVFGLGGILCALLTGRPPYYATTPGRVRALAAAADLGPAFRRLDACRADRQLVRLCKQLLHEDPTARPLNGGQVAQRLRVYREMLQAGEVDAQVRRVSERVDERVESYRVAVGGLVVLAAVLAVPLVWGAKPFESLTLAALPALGVGAGVLLCRRFPQLARRRE